MVVATVAAVLVGNLAAVTIWTRVTSREGPDIDLKQISNLCVIFAIACVAHVVVKAVGKVWGLVLTLLKLGAVAGLILGGIVLVRTRTDSLPDEVWVWYDDFVVPAVRNVRDMAIPWIETVWRLSFPSSTSDGDGPGGDGTESTPSWLKLFAK